MMQWSTQKSSCPPKTSLILNFRGWHRSLVSFTGLLELHIFSFCTGGLDLFWDKNPSFHQVCNDMYKHSCGIYFCYIAIYNQNTFLYKIYCSPVIK